MPVTFIIPHLKEISVHIKTFYVKAIFPQYIKKKFYIYK